MATSRQQCLMLLAVCCSVTVMPVFGDSLGRLDPGVPPELAGEPCAVTDPGDPQQILGPNPSHTHCLTALFPPAVPSSSSYSLGGSEVAALETTSDDPMSISLVSTLWLYAIGLAMLILAGFNSRKRHRHLPGPVTSDGFSQPPVDRRSHTEGTRWNED